MERSCSTPLIDRRYLVLETLGRGGMGTVYRAFDRGEQRLVALKVPSLEEPAGPAHPLAVEFDHWSRLRHPNIVRLYGMRHAESGPLPAGTPYLVLEHVHGRPAHQALEPGRADDATVETLAAQILSALHHVHGAGSLHRDLKPGNVLARRAPGRGLRFLLTDFGLAARPGDSRPVGRLSGSIPYLAPESLVGLPLDGRADLYGLGILLYQLTTGALPTSGGSAREILRRHLCRAFADPARIRPGISPRLAQFVRRLTMRDRDERPASAADALGLLGVPAAAVAPRPPLPLHARGALAGLRLALDAVRLGARRVFRLPAAPPVARELLRELSVWSEVRGLRCHRLDVDPGRLALRLLDDHATESASLVRRFGLNRWLAIDLLGGVPLPNPVRATTDGAALAPAATRAVCDLVLACAEQRPLVLCAGPGPSPLVRELRRRLANGRGFPKTGGLLLVQESSLTTQTTRLTLRNQTN